MSKIEVRSQNVEAERALLCTIFLSAPKSGDEVPDWRKQLEKDVFGILQEDDFFDERNAKIYSAVRSCVEKGVVPDFVTVGENIADKPYLLGLIDYLPVPVNLSEYAKSVKKHSLQRQADEINAKRRVLRGELDTSADNEKEHIRSEIDALLKQEAKIYRQIQELSEGAVVKKYTGENIRPPVLRCSGLLPEGHVSMLAGAAGTGKTYIALTLAALYTLETKKKALVWLSEDLAETEYRISQMLAKIPMWQEKKEQILENLRYIDDIPEPFLTKEYGTLETNVRMQEKMQRYIADFGFILLDPLTDFYAQEENNNTAARRFMNVLKSFVYKTDKILLVTHHTNKVSLQIENIDEIDKKTNELRQKVRGASAFIDVPQTTLYLLDSIIARSKNNLQSRFLATIKTNMSRNGVVRDNFGEPMYWELPFNSKDLRSENIREISF